MTAQIPWAFAIALVVGVAAIGVILWLADDAGVFDVEQPVAPGDRRSEGRRRIRELTGWAAALAVGATALVAAVVPTGSTSASPADPALPDQPSTPLPTSDPEAAIEDVLPGLDQRAPLDDDAGSDGFVPPQQPPSRGDGGGGFGSGGS